MPVLPSLRTDLEFSEQTHQDESVVVVKDPLAGRYFRFTATQAAILESLREPTDLESLARSVAERIGATVSVESLQAFLSTLEQKRLLDTPGVRAQLGDAAERRRPDQQSILYLRLFDLNAEGLIDWLFPKLGWMFTPVFHAAAVSIIGIGVVLTIIHAEALLRQALSLVSVSGIVMVWSVIFFVTALHELAHGLTCRHFGGRVRKIGFMLIYFSPAFYCDVSDAWMFPSRRQRVWVGFAGGYFQLVVWGAAVGVWRVAAQDTVISSLALSIILFGGIQTLFNFNPLIKLDGYYMLSDYLEIPNLREKSFRALKAWFSGRADPLLESTERRPLLTYGGLALTFSTLLLGVVYVNIYWLATSYFAFAGLVAFVLFSGFTLRRAAAEPVAGAKALVAGALLRKYFTLGIVVLLLLVPFVPWRLRIAAEFEILPNEEAIIRAETSGTIDKIYVRENDYVSGPDGEMGPDPIARLFDFDKERQLIAVAGEIQQKRAELELLESGPRSEEIDQAQRLVEIKETELANVRRNDQERNRMVQELEGRRAELRLAEIELETARTLYEEGLGARFDMETAAEQVEIRRSEVLATQAEIAVLSEANDRDEDLKERELDEARSALALLMAGFRTEEIEQRRVQLASLERQRRMLEDENNRRFIVAPISGTVVTSFIERFENRRLNAGDELGRIMELDTVHAQLWVPEKEMADVREGSPVALKVRAYPSKTYTGQVNFIAPVAQTQESRRVVEVRAQLDNTHGDLRPEMTGVAKIEGGPSNIGRLAVRRLIRWIRTEFWHLLP